MSDQQNIDKVRERVLIDNTAQGVLKYLRESQDNRANVLTRWIWELLQNARDASIGGNTSLIVSVEIEEDEVIFQHNGRKFEHEEIAHLIYHGSTKVEEEGTIGQYGSGFLTTHLLSPQINIAGRLEDGQAFSFTLQREVDSHQTLSKLMDQAWEDFKKSFSNVSDLGNFTTRFHYSIEEDSADVVEEGISTLKQCAAFVVVFNQEFSAITITSTEETMSFEVVERAPSGEGLLEIAVAVEESGTETRRVLKYLLTQGEKVELAIPLASDDDFQARLHHNDVPKLFLGFPLVRTENFSFPAIINSLEFTPTEGRDGVYLGQGSSEANLNNQAAIEEACELQVNLIQFAASSGWANVSTLADIPPMREYNWLNNDWLQQCLDDCLIEPIRKIPAVLCEQGAIAPEDAILPIAESEEAVIALRDLLSDLKEFRPKLPRREETVGWRNAVNSWAVIRDCDVEDFGESFDGRKLAEYVETEADDHFSELKKMIHEDVCPVQWLNRLYAFLNENDFNQEVRTRRIVLDQAGYLDILSNLHRDKDIDSELKRIADDILDLKIREELRDAHLTALADEAGKGDYTNKEVVERIIDELTSIARTNNLSDDFSKANVRLFAWIVRNEEWDYLDGFPAFSLNRADGSRWLPLERLDADEAGMPLAPVKAWTEDLQQYADLFPPAQILADEFYDAAPDASVWKKLAEDGIVRTNIITTFEENYEVFLPDEPLPEDTGGHETLNVVTLTDIAFLQRDRIGIMERVRRSPNRARLFWRFLTEWLVNHDSEGLTSKEAACECEEGAKHNYYPAAWLVPLVRNNWVPIGDNKRDKVNAKSLASLFRGSGSTVPIPSNDAGNAFLTAISVSRLDLIRETLAENEEDRAAMDAQLTNIMSATQGNQDALDFVPKFLEQLNTDPNLPDYLAERQKQTQIVYRNQQLGSLVEELVSENLASEGFMVEKTRVGADLLIQLPEDDVTHLTVSKRNEKWQVEVKATRDNDVRMTPAQARNAVSSDDKFLLCVVPVETDSDSVPGLDDVRDSMRFVEGMGRRVSPLCDALDGFEEYRNEITSYDSAHSQGAKLEIVLGNARVSVNRSVWETDGFRLLELAGHLRP